MSNVILKVNNLSKTYGGNTKALDNVSFNIAAGELVSVIGPSGAGKSTLFRCINKMVQPDKGSSIN